MSKVADADGAWNAIDDFGVKMPPRPSIPPVLWCAACMWLGMAAAESAAWACFASAAKTAQTAIIAAGVASSGVLAACAIRAIRKGNKRTMAPIVALLAFFCAFAAGSLHWQSWSDCVDSLSAGASGKRQYAITSDAHEGSYGWWSDATARIGNQDMHVRVYWNDEDSIVALGGTCTAYGRISIPSADEAGRNAHMQGRCGSVTLRSVHATGWGSSMQGALGPVRGWAEDIFSSFPGDGSAMLAGVVLGLRKRMSGGACEKAFKTCGLAHLLAVSGSHLVVVGSLAGWLLSKTKLRKFLRSFLLLLALCAYIVLSGLQPSAIRACIMTSCSLLGSLAGRRGHPPSALGACTCAMLLASPECAFSIGFSLSVVAVAGIILLAPLISAWASCLLPPKLRGVASPLSLTLSAQFATLALTVPAFSQLPLVSPLANLVVAPLITALLAGGLASLAVAAISPVAGMAVAGACSSLGNIISYIVSHLASLPYASIAVAWPTWACAGGCMLAAAGVWLAWPKPSRKAAGIVCSCAAVAVAISLMPYTMPVGPRIVMLDVGQGDAMLVQDGGSTVLIDTGEYQGKLTDDLARCHVSHIDAVVITHLHADHYLALSALGTSVKVDKVLFANPAIAEQPDCEAISLARDLVGAEHIYGLSVGDTLSVGGFSLRVISPQRYIEDGGNQDSICFDVRYKGKAVATLTGDAEAGVLGRLLESGQAQPCCMLKVGHHGSAAALSEECLNAASPKIALISVGAGNDYGHPSPETLSLLAEHGIPVYRTDRNGDITAALSEDGVVISCDTIGLSLLEDAA